MAHARIPLRGRRGRRVGVVLVGADFVQAGADEVPADAAGGERDFADGDDVADDSDPSLRP